MNPEKQHFYRLTFDFDNNPTKFMRCRTSFTHYGHEWCSSVHPQGDDLHVLLSPNVRYEDQFVEFAVQLIYDNRIVRASKSEVFQLRSDNPDKKPFHKKFITRHELHKFCTGKFTIQYVFKTPATNVLTDVPMTLEKTMFTDVQVACKDYAEKIDCNKCVLVCSSEAMRSAFTNPTSEESLTSTFTIRHHCATVPITRLLVKCMYEGWAEEMDDYAHELVIIADCYDCKLIAAMATESLKRRLTPDIFWDTAAVAVMLEEQQPNLLKICAKFADSLPNRLNELINRKDRGVNEEVAVVCIAVAALHEL